MIRLAALLLLGATAAAGSGLTTVQGRKLALAWSSQTESVKDQWNTWAAFHTSSARGIRGCNSEILYVVAQKTAGATTAQLRTFDTEASRVVHSAVNIPSTTPTVVTLERPSDCLSAVNNDIAFQSFVSGSGSQTLTIGGVLSGNSIYGGNRLNGERIIVQNSTSLNSTTTKNPVAPYDPLGAYIPFPGTNSRFEITTQYLRVRPDAAGGTFAGCTYYLINVETGATLSTSAEIAPGTGWQWLSLPAPASLPTGPTVFRYSGKARHTGGGGTSTCKLSTFYWINDGNITGTGGADARPVKQAPTAQISAGTQSGITNSWTPYVGANFAGETEGAKLYWGGYPANALYHRIQCTLDSDTGQKLQCRARLKVGADTFTLGESAQTTAGSAGFETVEGPLDRNWQRGSGEIWCEVQGDIAGSGQMGVCRFF